MANGIAEHLTGTDMGVILFSIAYLLAKIGDFILKVKNGNNNRVTPKQQSEMCKEHHAQLIQSVADHRTDAKQYMKDAFEILRANQVLIRSIDAKGKAIKIMLDAWKIEYDAVEKLIEEIHKEVTD